MVFRDLGTAPHLSKQPRRVIFKRYTCSNENDILPCPGTHMWNPSVVYEGKEMCYWRSIIVCSLEGVSYQAMLNVLNMNMKSKPRRVNQKERAQRTTPWCAYLHRIDYETAHTLGIGILLSWFPSWPCYLTDSRATAKPLKLYRWMWWWWLIVVTVIGT